MRALRFMTLVVLLLSVWLPAQAMAGDASPLTAHDLVTLKRLSDPQPSPDGQWVAYVLRSTDLEADRGRTDLWMVTLDGNVQRRLTTHEAGDFNPRWAADGKSLFFLSTRSGSSQVWRLPMEGGEAAQVTDLPLDIGNLELSPNGERIAFSLEVFADCEGLDCTVERLEKRKEGPISGRVYERLFVRHWDTWKDGRRSHLFTLRLNEEGAKPIDLSGSLDADVPSKPFGGSEEYAFSPDGRDLVFTARIAGQSEAWSTNFDLYSVAADGSSPPRNLTVANQAWDTAPVFSPDGKILAYLAMARPTYEADRFRVMVRDVASGKSRELTTGWDRSPGGLVFSEDGKTLYATANDLGNRSLFAIDVASGEVTRLIAEGFVTSPRPVGAQLVVKIDSLIEPADLHTWCVTGCGLRQITEVNADALAQIEMGEPEQFTFAGWNGETVHAWVVKPAGFQKGTKYPLAFLIHGGPQGSFGNHFHYRWNPQSYAGAGYAAVMIDFHGSTGYGQTFTDSIGGDWGGKPLEDLQKGLVAALGRYPWIDGQRACALGASYGGYMINWIAGNWADRFDCLVNHDGVFDTRSMYFETEELWFPEWEMRGSYWANPLQHEMHNPAAHVSKWKTPMLVIHGGLDYRVPESQGLQAFTALQRQGIPSRLLYYPDENHWVLKPNNSMQWHQEVLRWLGEWTEK